MHSVPQSLRRIALLLLTLTVAGIDGASRGEVIATQYGLSPRATAAANTVALQAALAAAARKHETVVVPAGLYVHRPLSILTAATITLQEGAVLRLDPNSTTSQVTIMASDVYLYGPGTLDPGEATQPNRAINAVYVGSGLSNIVIDKVVFALAPYSAIRVKGRSGPVTKHVTIQNCKFDGALKSHVIFLNWEVEDALIVDNHFASCNRNCIWVGNHSVRSVVRNNRAESVGRMFAELWNGSINGIIESNSVTFTGSDSSDYGISVAGEGFRIEDNTLDYRSSTDERGDWCIETVMCERCTVRSNVCYGARVGIAWDRSSNSVYEGNKIYSARRWGINGGDSTKGSGLHDNTIRQNEITLAGNAVGGIRIWCNVSDADCSGNQLVGNSITGSGDGVGLTMGYFSGVRMTANAIKGNAFVNLRVGMDANKGVEASIIENNTFERVGILLGGALAVGSLDSPPGRAHP